MTPGMKVCALLASIAAGLLPASAATAAHSLPPPVPTGRALLALTAHPHALVAVHPGAEWLLALAGADRVSERLGLWRVEGTAAGWLVPLLAGRGLLRFAEADRVRMVAGHLEQGDPLLAEAWQLGRVGADLSEPPSGGVPITIVDTGLDMSNPDFSARPAVTLLTSQQVGPFGTEQYHGTIVATSAAAAANGVGTVGVAPYSPLRVYDLPTLDDSDIIIALDRIAGGAPSVVNLSIGGPGFSRSLHEAVLGVVNAGSLVVAASGNSFQDGNPDIYPADTPHVLTVAGTDQADAAASFSSGGDAVDLAAPGVDIPVQHPTEPSASALADGTSFAAPIVSAAAAWVWTLRPELDASQLFELLRRSARDVGPAGWDSRTGYGVLDLQAALAAPAPIADPGEPNDDIDLIVGGRVFVRGKPALTGPGRITTSVTARLDAVEDPHDVYRVFVPGRRTLTVLVEPTGNVDLSVWSSTARSVLKSRRARLAASAHPGNQRESLTVRNDGKKGVFVYVDLSSPGGRGGATASYTLTVQAG